MKTSTPSTRSSSRHTLLSSALCRKASIECCKMLGTSSTPSAQTWSPARCSTSSTGSPEALVIADLDERFIHERSASLCVLRWLIGPNAEPEYQLHARDEALLCLREKLADQASAIPYVPHEVHKGYLFTGYRWKKPDVKGFSQAMKRQFP